MTSNGDLPNYPVNHSPVREIVTVFWDYENCPCPMSTKIATLTYDIKRRIDHFLGKKLNKRIQLYCPMQRLHERTRENATDLGILMMDVASKRKQESVDKRIIADIGLFATELAESSGNDLGHIVLVSGDSDYGYILARLRDKSYIGKIIIFINDYTKETLIQHADHTHCLFQSNLTRKDNPFSDLNQRKISPYDKIYSHASYQYSAPYHSHSHGHNHHNNSNSHFQLNNNNNHSTQKRAWLYNLPYNAHANTNGNHMSDMNKYNGPHRVNKAANSNSNANAHANSSKAAHNNNHNHSRSQGHALYNGSFNGSFGASILKKQQKGHRNRNRSPTEHGRYTQNNVKILQKEEKEAGNASTGKEYVYRRKGYKSPDMISAPPPIPPKPEGTACILTQVKLESNGSAHSVSPKTAETSTKTPAQSLSNGAGTKTKSHRIVSQENLEQQLKQRQKDAKKEKEAKLKLSPSRNCAEMDANNQKPQSSAFSVAALYKINERNDEESKSKLAAKPRADTASPTKFDLFSIADDDFFEAMIPNQTDMDELFKHIAPEINVLRDDGGSPKTSPLPLKNRLKMKKNHHKHSNTVITDQLRLVWDALCYCQANSNNTPRRREIYVAMNKTHSEYMQHRDLHFANECIDVCLSYGTVEEMIKGRISSLYILPVILNALTSNESTFYDAKQKLKMRDVDNKHVWITLDALKRHLVAGYTNHLSTYFTLTYLYRIIRNATRLFAFHKDDRQCHESGNDELNPTQLAQIRFRVRKGAYNNNQSQAAQYNDSSKRAYNRNHNLTFNYYS